ncbi:caspase-9 isoform X2 [Cephus cinctus]|uniref:Caspase-9 isoform X2 n=1 Tax=Cephus cinctus TaxID=211228 RepID=A0AAJ7BRR1_CEPCN|nr:caspase-9 isoform X2 [Cephus cinctus]
MHGVSFKMNAEHRARIESCCDAVIHKINMSILWPKLLQREIFYPDDVNIPEWTNDLGNEDIKRNIFLNIRTRGPNAFVNLCDSLRETGHTEIATLLENGQMASDKIISKSHISNVQEEEDFEELHDRFYTVLKKTNTPLQVKVKKATQFFDDPAENPFVARYRMRSNPRGYALIIVNIDFGRNQSFRVGAEHDAENTKQLFTQMGFKVFLFRDLSAKNMETQIKEFAQKDFTHVDSSFVIISSHGSQCTDTDFNNTLITGTDGDKISCDSIMEFFTASACPTLAGKPKVFIFQVCRGEQVQCAVKRTVSDTHMSDYPNWISFPKQTIRNYDDMFEVYSTLSGFVSLRDTVNGSWYIQVLCEVFMNHAHSRHILDLLHEVESRLATLRTNINICQTAVVTLKGITKHCYLHPGLFEDDQAKS